MVFVGGAPTDFDRRARGLSPVFARLAGKAAGQLVHKLLAQ